MTYNKRVWLNKETSPSTGCVVAFDGVVKTEDEEYRSIFLQIGDCFTKVKLHKADYDTIDDFIETMEILRNEINSFIIHLKQTKENEDN